MKEAVYILACVTDMNVIRLTAKYAMKHNRNITYGELKKIYGIKEDGG